MNGIPYKRVAAVAGPVPRPTVARRSVFARMRASVPWRLPVWWLCAACLPAPADWDPSAQLDEFKVKREALYEFAQRPEVTRDGDTVMIAFESKGLCDVTVAIENPRGQIVRHLASGVLGPNAPQPFLKNSRKQAIVWDGKDDQNVYIDDKDSLTVRVSLGLKAQFERTLFWSPKKRIAPGHRPNFAAAPEGVYVHEGGGVDHLRLFDHQGNYVRTVYPFPPDYSTAASRSEALDSMRTALAGVKGLEWLASPLDGLMVPQWQGIFFHTLFTSGDNAGLGTARINPTKYGRAASFMAWTPGAGAGRPGTLALAMRRLNRLATDGTTGSFQLQGPVTTLPGPPDREGKPTQLVPAGGTFSSDGKLLFMLIGHCLARLEFAGDQPPAVLVGDPVAHGKDDTHFETPSSLAIDAQDRLYVADYGNDRIQVFTPAGKLYKSIKFNKPLRLFVSPKDGHIYVGSWLVVTPYLKDIRLKATFAHLGPVDDPRPIAVHPLPFARYSEGVFMNRTHGTHEIFMDFHTDPPTLWVVPGSGDSTEKLMQMRRTFAAGMWSFSKWSEAHYRLYAERNGKLEEQANFARDVAAAIGRVDPPSTPAHERQRLYVNPSDGMLWVMEGDTGVGKATFELLKIDPDTGRTATKRLPFATEEIAFDLNNLIYLRTDIAVGRYDARTWREVPFDYGEEMMAPGFNGDGGKVEAFVRLPGVGKPGQFHLGGFGVSPNGNMVISCYNAKRLELQTDGFDATKAQEGRAYAPPIFPGRARYAEVHIWDRRGKVVHEDAVPGLSMTDGLSLDKDDNIYALWGARRLLPGQNVSTEIFPISSETLVKFKPGKGKVLFRSDRVDIPLAREAAPKRPPDAAAVGYGAGWAENAEWLYGGVGANGFIPHWAPNCSCWNARPALDLFARSFVTELARSRVAVLDTNGNLIMRIGKYGNVDDGVPLVRAGGPASPRSVGGDEVALAKPAYVAAHTDRRLFISDYGNYRILAVKLGYESEATVPLKGVPDRASRP